MELDTYLDIKLYYLYLQSQDVRGYKGKNLVWFLWYVIFTTKFSWKWSLELFVCVLVGMGTCIYLLNTLNTWRRPCFHVHYLQLLGQCLAEYLLNQLKNKLISSGSKSHPQFPPWLLYFICFACSSDNLVWITLRWRRN